MMDVRKNGLWGIAIAVGFFAIICSGLAFYPWITVFAIPGWLVALLEHKARQDQERLHAEAKGRTLPDGSLLLDSGERWMVFFPGDSDRTGKSLNLNLDQAARLAKLWAAAVAEAADKIYVGELTPHTPGSHPAEA
jgi:hypothetical protein